jgi:hypothetical protein
MLHSASHSIKRDSVQDTPARLTGLLTFGSLVRPPDDGNWRIVEVSEDRLKRLLTIAASSVVVDEAWYLNTYGDVVDAIRLGAVASAKEHYCKYGYFEDRLPRHIAVDETWYIEEYPDVAEAIQAGEARSAQGHFEADGFKEGRRPYADWML